VYGVQLTFRLTRRGHPPSVEVLSEALHRTPLADGRIEHLYARRTADGFDVVLFLSTRDAADVVALGTRCGRAVEGVIDSIGFGGCEPWPAESDPTL
jgi:hypothetical protein